MKAWFRQRRVNAEPSASTRIASTSRSHVGRVRAINEDRVLDRPDQRLWAVADGMGGHRGGDAAADAAIEQLASLIAPVTPDAILRSMMDANDIVQASSSGESGTTMVVAHIDDDFVEICWVGDSRAYLIRDRRLTQLTRDHSLVQQMVDAGALTPEQAHNHPRANVITRAIGVAAIVEVERTRHRVQAGDRLLLCSDGLSRSLCDRDVHSDEPLDALADRLLTNALQRDGSDNISLVVIELIDQPQP